MLIIAKYEFLGIIRDGRFRWSAIVIFFLLVASLAAGWSSFERQRNDRDAAAADSRRSWEDQGARNPHAAAHFGVYAFKPKTPLSLIDPGLDNFTGNYIWVEAHYQNPSRGRPIEDATALQRFGELTATSVLLVFLPLLIIFLSFDSIAGEKEKGTLRQLLSSGAIRRELALGKFLGVSAALLILLVPAVLLGLIALGVATGIDRFTVSLPRFGVLALGLLLYFGAFVGISLAVSSLASSSRAALVLLLAFWLSACLLAPRFANDIAERIYPTPTAATFWSAVDKDLKDGIDGHDPSNVRTKRLEEQLLAQYKVDKKEDLPINFNGIALNAGEEYANKVFDKHWGHAWQRYYEQETLQKFVGVIAPFIAARSVSMAMAGTDLSHSEHYSVAVEQYRRDLNRFLNLYFAENSTTKEGYNYFVDRGVWTSAPKFQYQPPSTAWALRGQTFNLWILLVWCLGAVGIAILTIGRVRV